MIVFLTKEAVPFYFKIVTSDLEWRKLSFLLQFIAMLLSTDYLLDLWICQMCVHVSICLYSINVEAIRGEIKAEKKDAMK